MTRGNKAPTRHATSPKAGPSWVEEYLPIAAIIKHGPLQVRSKLDAGAVSRYRSMAEAGKEAPPIKVGRVGDKLYLVDGWHRMEAGAITTSGNPWGAQEVLAHVADMSVDEVRWEAAKANMGHGVPLRTRELREVFKAFIKAKRHHLGKGKFMSYREMGAELGMGHTTLRNWTEREFPSLFRALGGGEHGNVRGDVPHVESLTMEQEHAIEAQAALGALVQHAKALGSPEVRWELLKGLEAAAEGLRAAGVSEPEPPPF
jgi:hypothetical protein